MWQLKNITVREQDAYLVRNASAAFHPGRLSVILGPNGAGKTSLLRAALGLQKMASGESILNDVLYSDFSPDDRARHTAYLPQDRPLAWPMFAEDIVALGRFAYGASPNRLSKADEIAVDSALSRCNLTHLVGRQADSLSGGEKARLHLARTLATEATWIIADEPIAGLDPKHQHEMMRVLKNEATNGKGVILVLHDLSLAARYADDVLIMKEGSVVCNGPTRQCINSSTFSAVYEIPVEVRNHDVLFTPAG